MVCCPGGTGYVPRYDTKHGGGSGALNVPGWLNRLMAPPGDVTDGDADGPDEAPAQPDDADLAARLRGALRPVPREGGGVVDSPLKASRQNCPCRPGGPLPARGGRHSRANVAAAQAPQPLPVAW